MIGWLARALERPLAVRGDADAIGEMAGERLDAIVVLGAPLHADRPSEALAERIAAAAALYAEGGAPRVVPTGGVTRGARRAEADVMAEELVRHGVPVDAITVEDRARTTAENAAFVAALLGDARVWLVTQPFHARRARWLFRRAGLRPRVLHIADSMQYRDRRRALRWVTREYAAWLRAIVTGGR
jgi:uncharacterized SAM-binding protein YcdF (DUF218 family)